MAGIYRRARPRSAAHPDANRPRSVAFAPVAVLELPPDHTAAARARRFVADTLRAWGYDDIVPDAELLVSELRLERAHRSVRCELDAAPTA
jgi:hypothetical protein